MDISIQFIIIHYSYIILHIHQIKTMPKPAVRYIKLYIIRMISIIIVLQLHIIIIICIHVTIAHSLVVGDFAPFCTTSTTVYKHYHHHPYIDRTTYTSALTKVIYK